MPALREGVAEGFPASGCGIEPYCVSYIPWSQIQTAVGPEGADGQFTPFPAFQIPIEFDYDIGDIKNIVQAQLGISADAINIRAGGDFRPDEAKLGPVFGRAFKEGWHMQCSVYPKGWKAAVERMHDEGEQERAEGGY